MSNLSGQRAFAPPAADWDARPRGSTGWLLRFASVSPGGRTFRFLFLGQTAEVPKSTILTQSGPLKMLRTQASVCTWTTALGFTAKVLWINVLQVICTDRPSAGAVPFIDSCRFSGQITSMGARQTQTRECRSTPGQERYFFNAGGAGGRTLTSLGWHKVLGDHTLQVESTIQRVSGAEKRRSQNCIRKPIL